MVKTLVPVVLLLLSAACGVLEQNPPPNIAATVVAESATVAAEAAAVASEAAEEAAAVASGAAEEAREAVSTVVALVTPEPQPASTRAVATPVPSPAPPATPTPPPTENPLSTRAPVAPGEDHNETVVTSLGRQVDVSITGFLDNSLRFEQLVQAINVSEDLLGIAYPAPTVSMELVDSVSGGFCGNNQPSYAPGLVGDPHIVDGSVISITVEGDCDDAFATIAHEVAHTWFHGSAQGANWIDEGLANAMERQVIAAGVPDQVIYPPVSYCSNYANISELEQADPPRTGEVPFAGYSCNYSLGDGIFSALQEHFGTTGFNRRIIQLAKQAVNDTNREPSIVDIKSALGGDAVALEIINRWYDGQPEMRKYLHLGSVEWTFPPTIDGEYLHFAGRTSDPEVVSDFILGDHPYCSQFSLLSDAGHREWVASVSDPLPAGWIQAEIPKVIVINDQISSQTGEFSVTANIGDPSLAGNSGLSLLVTGRVMAGADDICHESVRYSQLQITAGEIPSHLKIRSHYHADAIEWISPPAVTGETMTFSGRAQPGTISIEWRDGHCSQFSFYERDPWGYHFIDSLDPRPPGGQFLPGQQTGEITAHRIAADGTFEATAQLATGALDHYNNPVLLVTAPAPVDTATGQCGDSEVLSALDIQRN